MKHVIATELKSSVWNLRFIFGILLIVVSSLIAAQAPVQSLIQSGTSAEGAGWYVAFQYCTTGVSALLFIPIAVTFAAGCEAQEELRTRFALFSCSRVGWKPYLLGKTAGAIISGGLMVCIGMVIILAVVIPWAGHIPAVQGHEATAGSMAVDLVLALFRGFLNGALWSLVGSLAAVVTRNRYMAYAVPFIVYYVLTVFQERYYRKLFFLSPRYWASPSYYSNAFCIGILLVLCILTGLLLMGAVKRRLEYA